MGSVPFEYTRREWCQIPPEMIWRNKINSQSLLDRLLPIPNVCLRVVSEKLVMRDAVGEDDIGGLEAKLGIEADESVEIVRLDGSPDAGLAAGVLAHREQAHAGGDVLLVVGEDAQQVVMPLVRRDAADEQEVGARVGKTLPEHGIRGF